jgi:small subunit ribosomal protein S21
MLIVKVDNKGNIERALKELKGKVIKTKQNKVLFEKKEFEKNSVKKRKVLQKAEYLQKFKNNI